MRAHQIDVRTKLFLILYSAVMVFLFYSTLLETSLVLLTFALQFYLKKSKTSVKLLIIYFVFVVLQYSLLPVLPQSLVTVVSMFVVSFRRLFPCAMAGILLIQTTQVSDLMSGLYRLKLPKQIVIPLAVTLRYIPAINEEWHNINDAMRIRSFHAPGHNIIKRVQKKIECYYVPLLVSASQIAEELSAAAVTRGIENPAPRTILHRTKFRLLDWGIFLFLIALLGLVLWQQTVAGGMA